ncbi:MAG: VCBS repeat-containing protein [Saprospiraceae bacterium]|nr:VCBS repeat-containing protein [Saprospiraceae bacterium]
MHFILRISLPIFTILYLCQCSDKAFNEQFTLLESNDTGLKFRNKLKEDENFNIFKYQYYYNGGGVAVADFNNDGMQDVFFTGNMVKNRLFVNKGNLEFNDITESSGVAINEGWCTGANAVDINNDGWMDIYVCRAGYPFPKLRKNLLLINNGNLTFTDKAAEYGLDDDSYSTHSAFLDYDKDGDLDMFLLNHSDLQYSKGSLEIFKLKNKREPELESKLFRNDNGKYVEVTESAGIKGNVLSLSLGLRVVDINNDGWTDIFVGNDFNESDYLFINNADGTFTENAKSSFDHTSMFSMGCDIADINNDGHMDMVSLDMLPESNYLQKLHSGADNFNKISDMILKGIQPQFSKNVLQISNGDGTFSESAQLYGVSNTDWSWSSLFLDFDHDTYQDLFISNGYLKDHTDMDFLQFTADQVIKADKGENPVSFEEYMASMPPIIQPNYFFSNAAGKNLLIKCRMDTY